MKVLTDKGKLVVAILDGKRRVRVGTLQAAGKETDWGLGGRKSIFFVRWIATISRRIKR
jgi:hypothetical protein